ASKRRTGCIPTDETNLVSLIRTIVREEVHRLVNQTQESLTRSPVLRRDRSRRVERVLAPVSTKTYAETRPRPTYAAVTRKYMSSCSEIPTSTKKNRCGERLTTDLFVSTADALTYPRRHIADPVSRQAVGARKIKRERPSKEVRPRTESSVDRQDDCHDVILGWDFLEASRRYRFVDKMNLFYEIFSLIDAAYTGGQNKIT
ncbi:hypothetical protein TNCV_8261, partial [Trichonephila clavipes]